MSRNIIFAVVLLALAGCKPSPPTVLAEDGFRIAFDEHGQVIAADRDKMSQIVKAAHDATDVIVFSHGWRNNPATAECLYHSLVEQVRKRRPSSLSPDRFRPILVGVYWPSAIFPVDGGDCTTMERHQSDTPQEAGAGDDFGALLTTWATSAFPRSSRQPEFQTELAEIRGLLSRERTGQRLSALEGEKIAEILIKWRAAERDTDALEESGEGPENPAFEGSAASVAKRWRVPKRIEKEDDLLESGSVVKWLDFANVFTFWMMKERAGIVGSRGLYEVIRQLQPLRAKGVRIHLIGHSFGGKVVSASLVGKKGVTPNRVDTLLIFQGALSHFAYSTRDQIRQKGVDTLLPGLYANIIADPLVSGPVVITFSKQDKPNQVFYPLGVRMSGDYLEADTVAKYGSIGADGVQGPIVDSLTLAQSRVAERINQQISRVYNVDASNVIMGHSDLQHEQVYQLIWDVIEGNRQLIK
jgi:hypothetical protein